MTLRTTLKIGIGALIVALIIGTTILIQENDFDYTITTPSQDKELIYLEIQGYRQSMGLEGEIMYSKYAEKGAQEWANKMNELCIFTHGEGELDFQARSQDYNYPGNSREILALSTERPTNARYIVWEGWAKSQSHNEAMLAEDAGYLGIGIKKVTCAEMLDKNFEVIKEVDDSKPHHIYVVHIIPKEVKD